MTWVTYPDGRTSSKIASGQHVFLLHLGLDDLVTRLESVSLFVLSLLEILRSKQQALLGRLREEDQVDRALEPPRAKDTALVGAMNNRNDI